MFSEQLAKALAKSRDDGSKDLLYSPDGLRPAGADGPNPAPELTEDDDGARLMSVLDVVVRHARFLTQAEGAAIALTDGAGVVCRATCGLAPELGVRLEPNAGICGQCYANNEEIVWSVPEGVASAGFYSVIAVPIRFGATKLGLVAAFSTARDRFSKEQLPSLNRVADAVAQQLRSDAAEPPAAAEHALIKPLMAITLDSVVNSGQIEANPSREEPSAGSDAATPQPLRPTATTPEVTKFRKRFDYRWVLLGVFAFIVIALLAALGGRSEWLERSARLLRTLQTVAEHYVKLR